MPEFDPASMLEDAGIEVRPPTAADWTPRPKLEPADSTRSLGDFLSTAAHRDWAVYGLASAAAEEGMEFDETFSLSDVSEAEWKEMTAGIPEEYWDALASAKSRTHLHYLIDRTREGLDAEERLASYGGWGVAGRVAVGIADPLGIALAIGTGGLGVLPRAERLAEAVRVARQAERFREARAALGTLEVASKASTTGAAVRTGLLAAAENMALESALVAGDPTRDGWDVLHAGLGGLVLGGTVGKLLSRREQSALQVAFSRERRLAQLAELDEALKVRRGELLSKLQGTPEEIRIAIRELDDETARLKAEGFDLDTFDVPTARARYSEIEAHASHKLEELRVRSEGAPKAAELAEARREAKAVRRQMAEAEQGADVATLSERLTRAEDAERRLTAADIARAELRRIQGLDQGGKLRAESDKLRKALGLIDQRERLAPAREILQQVDALDQAGVSIDDAAASVATHRAPQELPEDTLSAARAVGVVDDLTALLKAPSDALPAQGRMQFTAATKLVGGTFAGVLRGSTNPRIRSTLGRLVGNPVGAEDASRVDVGASEVAARISKTKLAKFYSAVTPAYRQWAERRGFNLFDRQTRKVRDSFMREVGLHVRGQAIDPDPAVVRVAERQAELYAEFLQEAKDAGVKGFENVETRSGYLPRVFDYAALGRLEKDFGTEAINQLVIGAIRAADDELPEELADRIGRAYVKRLRQLRIGSDAHLLQGVRWDDVGFLRQFLTDSGMAPEEVGKVVDDFAALNARRARQVEGDFRHAKRRTSLDENFALKLRRLNSAGESEWVEVRFSDLLDNNAEALFQRYARSVSGHIGLAKVGITSRADFQTMLREAENELQGVPDELAKVKSYAETAYKLITGQPIEDATLFSRIARTARDWNFATTMNQAGFAQVPDVAALLSRGYLRYTLKSFGWAFKAMRRSDGTLDDGLARELEEWVGLGTDYHNNGIFSSYDEGGGAEAAVGAIGHTARVLGRGTQAASGMAFITSLTQRMASRAIVQRLVRETLEGGAFSARRAADLGLDSGISERIGAQIRKHTQFLENEAGGSVRIVNWAAWDDPEARDAMLNAVFREARRIVQEEDLGDTSKWMHSTMGKLIVQFRRFALVSYSRQLLHGVAHQDAETYTRLVVSMALAAIAYKARWELRILQIGDADRKEEMRRDYLSWDRLAAASFANSSYSSLLPAVYDSTAGELNDARMFDTRTSGLNSDLFRGIPTVALGYNASSTVKALYQAALRDDRQVTQSDVRAMRKLLPYQNLLGMDYVFDALTRNLPEKDLDEDPDSVDWGFNR